jgi:hypothetical protein
MKKGILFICILAWTQALWAQPCAGPNPAPIKDGWRITTATGLNLGQMSFNSNWAAGGTNVLSVNGQIDFSANYLKDLGEKTTKTIWLNNLKINYGVQRSDGFGTQKSIDNLKYTSTLATRISKDLFASGDALYAGVITSLFTQIAPGYMLKFKLPDGSVVNWGQTPGFTANPFTQTTINPRKGLHVSNFMAPGYLWLRAGVRYLFSAMGQNAVFVQFAPLSLKQTYLIDANIRLTKEELANPQLAAFDIYGTGGKIVKNNLGTTFDMDMKLPLVLLTPTLQNIIFVSDIVFFTPYEDPALDLMGTFVLQGKINQYLSAKIMTHVIYNENIDTDFGRPGKQTGLQVMGNFGIGINLMF